MTTEKRVSPRVVAHVEKLREAGLNTEAFFSALVAIRDDSTLTTPQREAIYRMIAVESYVWYLEALRGEPVDRIKLMQEAHRVAQKNEVAIKKRSPGDSSVELAGADIGAKIPKEGPTVKERPPLPAPPQPPKKVPAKPGPTLSMRPPKKK